MEIIQREDLLFFEKKFSDFDSLEIRRGWRLLFLNWVDLTCY